MKLLIIGILLFVTGTVWLYYETKKPIAIPNQNRLNSAFMLAMLGLLISFFAAVIKWAMFH